MHFLSLAFGRLRFLETVMLLGDILFFLPLISRWSILFSYHDGLKASSVLSLDHVGVMYVGSREVELRETECPDIMTDP
jgi:hypothetical protein